MNIKQKIKDNPEKAKKVKKIAIFSSIGVAVLGLGIGSGFLIKRAIDSGYTIGDNRNNYKVQEYRSDKGNKKYEYLNSLVLKDVELAGTNEKRDINAHSFLIGKVLNVPFYASAGVKFEYEDTQITVSYKQISMQTISSTLAHTTTKSENSHWQDTDKYDQDFKAQASVGISKFKAETSLSLSHSLTRVRGGELSTVYTTSDEETISSCEAFQKSSDYTISLKTANGFEKGKYYRLTLQQSVSMFVTVYEKPAISANETPKYFYEINNFLDDPMDYSLVIEKSDEPTFKESESSKFDNDIYEDCIYHIEYNEKIWTDTPTKEELIASAFKHKDSVESDHLVADPKISESNPLVIKNTQYDPTFEEMKYRKFSFEKLFASNYGPTLNDLLVNDKKTVDVTIDLSAKKAAGDSMLDIGIVRSVDYFTKVLAFDDSTYVPGEDREIRNYYIELKGIELSKIAKDLTVMFKLVTSSSEQTFNDNADNEWDITRFEIFVTVNK